MPHADKDQANTRAAPRGRMPSSTPSLSSPEPSAKRARTAGLLHAAAARMGEGLVVRLVPANLSSPPCAAAIDVAGRCRLATHAPAPPFVGCTHPGGCVCVYRIEA